MGIQRGPDVPALGAKGSFGPALSFPFHLWPIPSPVLPPYHRLKAPTPLWVPVPLSPVWEIYVARGEPIPLASAKVPSLQEPP